MNEMFIFNKQNSQSGQALVEYVLLLVIAIAIILGLANQLYKPFGSWMKDYMGQYVECLLDMGELPTIGGSTASGVCNSKFKSFSVKDGWKLNNSSQNKNHNNKDEEDAKAKSKSHQTDETASASGSNGSGGRSSASRRHTPFGRSTGADGPGDNKDGKQLTEALPQSQFYKLKSSGSSLVGQGTIPQDSRKGMVIPIDPTPANSKKENSVKIAKVDESSAQTQSKKLIIKPAERKVAAEAEDQPWSFGQYIKFALILVIIVAIVLFLGGQILQISKGMEK